MTKEEIEAIIYELRIIKNKIRIIESKEVNLFWIYLRLYLILIMLTQIK